MHQDGSAPSSSRKGLGGCFFETSWGAEQGLEVLAGLGNPDGTWVQSFCRTQMSPAAGERRCFRGLGLKKCLFPGIFQLNVMKTLWSFSFSCFYIIYNKEKLMSAFPVPGTVFPVPLLGGGAPGMSEKNRDGDPPLRGPVLRGNQIPD